MHRLFREFHLSNSAPTIGLEPRGFAAGRSQLAEDDSTRLIASSPRRDVELDDEWELVSVPTASQPASMKQNSQRVDALVSPGDLAGARWKAKGYSLHLKGMVNEICGRCGVADLSSLCRQLGQQSIGHVELGAVESLLIELFGSLLEIPQGAEGEGNRNHYRHCLMLMRSIHEAMATTRQVGLPIKASTQLVLRETVRAFYDGFDGFPFFRDLIEAVEIQAGSIESVLDSSTYESISIALQACYEAVKQEQKHLAGRNFLSGFGHHWLRRPLSQGAGFDFDPTYQSNPPYRHFELRLFGELGVEHNVRCIRMGTQTQQTTAVYPSVTPEWKLFLQSMDEGEHHVYFNRQRRSTGWSPSELVEGARSSVLEALENECPERLTVVSLPADGSFYTQDAEHDDQDWEQFKKSVETVIECNSDGFYFPEALRTKLVSESGADSFSLKVSQLLDGLHRDIGAPESMGRDERRAFLFHFINYTLVVEILTACGANTYNMTCKDGIDRAGVANAYMVLLCFLELRHGTAAQRADALQRLKGVVFGPALWAQSRVLIDHRFTDLTRTMRWLDRWMERTGATFNQPIAPSSSVSFSRYS